MKRFSLVPIAIASLSLSGTAWAQVVITSGPSSAAAGAPGLTGDFYFTNSAPITSIGMAQAYIAGHADTGTFTATEAGITGSANGFGYSAQDAGSAKDFLQVGGDGASYAGPTTTLDDGLFDFQGYLNVASAGTLQFSTFSDDGSALFIAGQQVVGNDGVHAQTRASGSATFAQAGLYPLELVYFNHVVPEFQGGGGLQADFGGARLLQLAPAPELSGGASFCLGVFGLGALGWRARRRASPRQV